MGIATISSLSVAWWLTHQEPRTAQAAEAPGAMIVAAETPARPATPGQPAQIARSADGHYWA